MRVATNEDAAAALAALRRALRHSSRELVIHSRQGWVAAPHKAGGDFSSADAERIATAAEQTGDLEIWVITGIDGPYEVYAVPASAEAIREARNLVATTDAVFLPRSERWMYLASEAEFGVALGDEASVSSLIGRHPTEARAAFRSYLDLWQSVPHILEVIAEAPWDTYESLPENEAFVVRWR